jgi:hypothetical protein
MKLKYLFSTLALLAFASNSQAVQTDNFGIHAAPAPGPIAVDGKLDDWDLSGRVLMTYDIASLRDVYSAQVATMYDADNFYVALHWKDPIPLGNIHDPRYQANKGWAGDAVQMRFKTDRIAHVTAWYYAPKQEPALQIDYGKSFSEPFGGGGIQLFRTDGWKMEQGAEMAFQKDADNRGYVQEIKLPWKLITTNKKFQAGDRFSLGFELLWGEADFPVHRYADNLQPGSSSREFFWTAKDSWGPVTLASKGKFQLPEPAYMAAYRRATEAEAPQGPVAIAYNLPKAARVSLVIEDASGKRIRNLIPAVTRKAGRNVEKWDGLDDNGQVAPPGEYSFKAIYHDGIHANYVLSFANPGNPTWETPDNKGAFYGDHTPPQAAAASGDYVALATPMGEAGKHLIATNLEGQRLWGLNNRIAFDGGRISLATNGKVLWVATEGKRSIIYRVNIATGRYAPWQAKATDATGKEYDVLDLEVSQLPGMIVDKTTFIPPNMRGIAVHNNALAVAFSREDAIRILDATTGATQKQYSISEPQAVVFTPSGELIALSQGRLLRLDANGKTSPFAHDIYAEGYGLAADVDGNIYLSVRGAHQNVKVLSPQGALLREIGKRGGRPLVGAYDAEGMRNPAGLTVDSRGHLWVTEETMNPKRTSVWDIKSGRLWKDLSGTTTYAGAGALNRFDPTMAFSDNTVYRLNFSKGTSHPIYSLGSLSAASHGETPDHPDNLFPPVVHAITSKVVKRGAMTYIFTSGTARGANEVHATLFDGKVFRSVVAFGLVPKGNDRRAENAKYSHAVFAEQEGKCYLWTDGNGDGLVQRDEIVFHVPQINGQAAPFHPTYWGQLPDDEGNVIYMASGPDGKAVKDGLYRFPITEINRVGAPVYTLLNPQIMKLSQPLVNPTEGMVMGGGDGRVYINQNPLIALDRSGKVLGAYPSRHVSVHGSHQAKAARPGYLIGPSSFLGTADMDNEIGEIFYLNGNLGENYLFTHDGLYIQSLFKDTRGYFDTPVKAVRGMSMDAMTAGGESFGGNFIKAPDGKFYVTLGGTDARVLEVTGLGSIKRLGGKFSYSPTQFAEAQRLAQQNAAQTQAPKVFTVARGVGAIAIDGKADEWSELLDDKKPLLEIQESAQQRYARVAARYDANNLYLAYRVFGPRGTWRNAGQNEKLLFKTGDAVDLMIGPEKSVSGAGNLRLLMTTMDGEPMAVLNQKVAPGARPEEKFDFSSPWRTISFDRVVTAREVKLGSGAIADGYFVEAAIPWSTLGMTPQTGLKLGGDVGVLFADNGGTQTISRQYWSNKATGLVNDVPGEADLTPDLWGTFVLE